MIANTGKKLMLTYRFSEYVKSHSVFLIKISVGVPSVLIMEINPKQTSLLCLIRKMMHANKKVH